MASWHVVPTSSSSRWHLWYMWTSVSKHIVTCLYRKICLYRIIHLRVQLYMSRYVCIHIVFFKAIETPNKCDDDHLIFSIYLECTVKIYIINSFVMYTYIVNIYIVNRYIYSSHTYIYLNIWYSFLNEDHTKYTWRTLSRHRCTPMPQAISWRGIDADGPKLQVVDSNTPVDYPLVMTNMAVENSHL